MARRALQCAAVDQGAPKRQELWKQVKWLDDNRKITAQQRVWADAARWVGNHGAHDTEPNVLAGQPTITNVTKDDAEDTSEGFLRGLEPEHAGCEMLQLPFAKLRLLDVEPHDRRLD
jgi:hypothetical protein